MNQQENAVQAVTPISQPEIPFIKPDNRSFSLNPLLAKSKAGDRAKWLTQYFGAAYVTNDEARSIYVYDGSLWEYFSQEKIEYLAAQMLDYAGVDITETDAPAIYKVIRQRNPRMGVTPEYLIAFKNGVFDMQTATFRPATPHDWLITQNGIRWSTPHKNESLSEHAPHFYKWLSFVRYDSEEREEALLALLYMVLTCRNNWHLFPCLSGVGGSGKSVLMGILLMLAGEHNSQAISVDSLGGDFGLEHLISARLLLGGEVPAKLSRKVVNLIKAISGGDMVYINKKGKTAVSAVLRAIFVFAGNEPFDFGVIDSGLERRAVNFGFSRAVPDSMKDDQLLSKIAAELPVVIRHLLKRFPVADMAKQALIRQRDGAEAKRVKYEGSPLERFLSSLEIDQYASLSGRNGMFWNAPGHKGTGIYRYERQYVYHAYLSFCDYEGIKPSLTVAEIRSAINYRFADNLRTGKGSGNQTITNLRVRDDAEYLTCPDSPQQTVVTFPGKK
ncbi:MULTISPECIES: DNA primase family protein [Enterobacteriaceae]|uniref:SF3 helicase domain-containing protein n=1 Tax=Enterobacter sichuanensis TaxID=2071710 RepID=A0A0F0ZT28_9ENTR|nr:MULTISPECIES: DUF5906 domain-containing protein [Enterobacteriaceae]KJN12692.1 hypothetical protein SS37_25285 [Enterobacter sichuanensis]